ncbi:MAG: hypothetical protein R3352_10030 [Salinisphaeraceae bacterium]|nr:hypothetical protein [Salinisphaeraceae bacterium]
MLDKSITGLLLIVGLINFLPVIGLFVSGRMQTMYGVDLSDPNLMILMRHRALLFGLVGGFILLAAFKPDLQPLAFAMGLLSMLGFILIAWQQGGYGPGIAKVVSIDWLAIVLMLIALGLYAYRRAQA